MAAHTDFRLALRGHGYFPLPLRGKRPAFDDWTNKYNTNSEEILLWEKMYGDADNTGILCRYTPALDIDIINPEAAEAIEQLIIDRFADYGHVLVRIGKAPKRAVLFHTRVPFSKIKRRLIGPDGSEQQIELLGDGQQVVIDGIHPDTGKPYRWHGGNPAEIAIDDLPAIDAISAKQLIDDATQLIIEQFGYREQQPRHEAKPNGGHRPDQDGPNWPLYIANVIDHDILTQFAAALIRAGLAPGVTVNLLRARVGTLPPSDRQQRRWREIVGMVESAQRKFAETATTVPDAGFTLHWHGEADPRDTRPWLVETVLPQTGAGLISGQWGTYKTFIALDLAAAVMTGGDFIKFPVRRQGGVLFIACEGQNEIPIRLTAAIEARGYKGRAVRLDRQLSAPTQSEGRRHPHRHGQAGRRPHAIGLRTAGHIGGDRHRPQSRRLSEGR
jgi:hypothetical protein